MDQSGDSGEVTVWLRQWAQGQPAALDHLAPLVFDQLRTIADNLLRNEARDHTLQPTALVSETFLKLLDVHKVSLNDRSHFFAFAARLMRRILIDHARRLKAGKRSVAGRLPLDSELAWTDSLDERSLDLSVALEELEKLDAVAVRALECAISWAAPAKKPRRCWAFPGRASIAACGFPWPGCTTGCIPNPDAMQPPAAPYSNMPGLSGSGSGNWRPGLNPP